MKPPIIVDEKGPVYIFESVREAERYLEPIDVKDNRYVAYDSEGRLLKLIPTEPTITIESIEPTPAHSLEVRQVLLNHLRNLGVDENWLSRASLEELVKEGLARETN